jgi:hypothetical protein
VLAHRHRGPLRALRQTASARLSAAAVHHHPSDSERKG